MLLLIQVIIFSFTIDLAVRNFKFQVWTDFLAFGIYFCLKNHVYECIIGL